MLQVIRNIRDLCSAHWAQFNLTLMSFALVVMAMLSLGIISNKVVSVYWWVGIPIIPFLIISYDKLSPWAGVTHPITVLVTLATAVLTLYRPVRSRILISLQYRLTFPLINFSFSIILKSENYPTMAGTAVILIMSIGFTTNSYILVEDYIVIFLSGSFLVANYIDLHQLKLHRDHALLTLLFLLCSRLSATFFGCREEQFWCVKTWWLKDDDVTDIVRSRRYFVSVCIFAGLMYGLYRYQKHQGSLVSGVLRVVHCFVHPVQCTLVTVYWALSASSNEILTDAQLCLFPLSVYFLSLLSVSLILYSPCCVLVDTTRHSTPRLFGGVACYSSPSLTLYTSILPPCALLLRHPLSPTLALLTVQLLCLSRLLHARDVAVKLIVSHVIVVQYFYATGHQAAVQQFDWNAAFVGFTSHGNHVIVPVLLIALRTLMSGVLVTVFLPTLLLYAPTPECSQVDMTAQPPKRVNAAMTRGVGNSNSDYITTQSCSGKDTHSQTAQLQYYTDPALLQRLYHTTLRLSTVILLVKCGACCLACFIHRRHLMIWNIFTPRMITEVCLSLSVSVCLVGVTTVLSRTQQCITHYLDKSLKGS